MGPKVSLRLLLLFSLTLSVCVTSFGVLILGGLSNGQSNLPSDSDHSAVCKAYSWLPDAYKHLPGQQQSLTSLDPHCSFVFHNACVQMVRRSDGSPEITVEVGSSCYLLNNKTTDFCKHVSGPADNNFTVVVSETERVVPTADGFDPIPTLLLDRTGGFPGSLYHDFSAALYPLYQNMVSLGIKDYQGWRIALIDGHDMPKSNGKRFEELYFVYKQKEFVDWTRELGFRKCFAKVVLMRSYLWKWSAGNHVVAKSKALTGYADFVARHFGLMTPRPPVPSSPPKLMYLERTDSRRLLNWDDLRSTLDMPYIVHNASQSWAQQIAVLRESSILFGSHGAGMALVIFAPFGAVLVEVYNYSQGTWLYRNMAISSGHYQIQHTVRDPNDLKLALEYGPNKLGMLHYADVVLPREDFSHLVDSSLQLLHAQLSKIQQENEYLIE